MCSCPSSCPRCAQTERATTSEWRSRAGGRGRAFNRRNFQACSAVPRIPPRQSSCPSTVMATASRCLSLSLHSTQSLYFVPSLAISMSSRAICSLSASTTTSPIFGSLRTQVVTQCLGLLYAVSPRRVIEEPDRTPPLLPTSTSLRVGLFRHSAEANMRCSDNPPSAQLRKLQAKLPQKREC
jgi:hypothetical protein